MTKESFLTAVETCYTECRMGGERLDMIHLHMMLVAAGSAYLHFGAMRREGILGVGAQQSSLGIHSVEGALWTAKHINAVNIKEVAVVSALVHQGDMVEIKTYRRTARTRTYASHINRGGETGTIAGHDKRGHMGGHVAHGRECITVKLG